MPKSKRNRLVTLSRTRKKGFEGKRELVEQIHKCLEDYAFLYTFEVNNMRNALLKEVRAMWKNSRFFFGKNKVMAVALGRTPQEETKPNLHKVAEQLVGQTGLFFTNQPREDVIKFFKGYRERDYARSGFEATETVKLQPGPLTGFSHSLEAYLRSLGMPTALKAGTIELLAEYTVCKVGEPLTPEQAKLLKLLGKKMCEFSFTLKSVWSNGKFELLDATDSTQDHTLQE
jgi:mRNA turnover protein 4